MSERQKEQDKQEPALEAKTADGKDRKPNEPTPGPAPAKVRPQVATAVRKTAAPAKPPEAAPVASDAGSWRRHGAIAAAAVAAVGLGWFGGARLVSGGETQAALTQWSEATAGIRQSREDVVRLTGDVRALKVAVDALKDGIERVRGESVGKQTQLLERLDRLDRVAEDSSAKAGRVAEQLERLASAGQDPVKLSPLVERLERVEKQASTTVAKSVAPPPAAAPAPTPAAPLVEPGQTGSIDAKPQTPKQAMLEGWVLRDIYDGVALIEGPNRRLHEVAPGQTIGSVGRIEAFERRGKAWVVVTSKGVIGTERWQ